MQVHYLQHVPYEGPASLEDLLRRRGHRTAATRLDRGDSLPPLDQFDWLIVLGGPMGIYDCLPWLSEEKQLIQKAIEQGKTVLGICLGAQLIADVLGARVRPNRYREIGWFDITRLESATISPFGPALPDRLEAFHWHGDTFGIPAGAVPLASSEACSNQAFSYGNRVLALQFHLETTPAAARALISHAPDELRENSPYVQSAEAMLSEPQRFARLRQVMSGLIDQLTALSEPAGSPERTGPEKDSP